jgi:hypothetical protein
LARAVVALVEGFVAVGIWRNLLFFLASARLNVGVFLLETLRLAANTCL